MSEENVEVIRRGFEAWNRNDFETLMADYAPDVVVVPPAEWPEGSMLTGRDDARAEYERMKTSWEEERIEVDELRDLGERVLALFRWCGRGKGSRVEVEHLAAAIYDMRGGMIVRAEFFFEDRPKALEAAGLLE